MPETELNHCTGRCSWIWNITVFVSICICFVISDDAVWRLSVWRLSRTSSRRAACAAGRLDGAYWLIGPGSAGLAQGCRCALPLQAWRGHIVAAARLQLVIDVEASALNDFAADYKRSYLVTYLLDLISGYASALGNSSCDSSSIIDDCFSFICLRLFSRTTCNKNNYGYRYG